MWEVILAYRVRTLWSKISMKRTQAAELGTPVKRAILS